MTEVGDASTGEAVMVAVKVLQKFPAASNAPAPAPKAVNPATLELGLPQGTGVNVGVLARHKVRDW